MEEKRIDCSNQTPEELALAKEQAQTLFKLNHTMPYTEEYDALVKELFPTIGEGSRVNTPLTGVRFNEVKIGKNCVIMNGCLMMSAGGITIEDGAMIAANCQLISNNHDPYERCVITCKPVQIKKGAWIGAGSTILPRVTVGKYAIVGASSTVTKDIPDYAVAVGSPAKVIKYLDKEKFND